MNFWTVDGYCKDETDYGIFHIGCVLRNLLPKCAWTIAKEWLGW